MSIESLRQILSTLPAGEYGGNTEIEMALAAAWEELSAQSDRGGIYDGRKLLRRTEGLTWSSPFLTFEIERHGAVVAGSVYAEVQFWKVDLDRGRNTLLRSRKRLVRARQQPMRDAEMARLAATIVGEMADGVDAPYLKRKGAKVRFLVGRFPALGNCSACQRTLAGRRTRFRFALEKAAIGRLQCVGLYRFAKWDNDLARCFDAICGVIYSAWQ